MRYSQLFARSHEPVLFEGQLEDSNDPGTRLYPVRFCRQCGHDYYVVAKLEQEDGTAFLPRNIDDTPDRER